jgi:hypothetical protein
MTDEHRFTAEQVDAAVDALSQPDRLGHAQEVITHAAPGLTRILDAALSDGGYFDAAHESQIEAAASAEDPAQRNSAIRALVHDEVRIGMLIGASVGFELARELHRAENNPTHPPEEN